MLRNIGKTFGSAMAALCLVSSLMVVQTSSQTLPQGQSQNMTCTKDNGKGVCTAARTADGKEVLVVGQGLERGDSMTCIDRGNIVDCKPVVR
jgi:hypothetical protein